MKRRFVGIMSGLFLSVGVYAANVSNSVSVNVMDLQNIKPVDTYYTGEVEAINKGIFSFENPGKLQTIVRAGDYVFAPIETKDGKIIRPGTILAKQHTERLEYALKAAEMEYEIAKADFYQAQKEFDRNKHLITKKIVSPKDFLNSKTAMLNAKVKMDKAENAILQAKYEIDVSYLRTPYSGIVTKTFLAPGARAGDGDEAVEVTQMSPLLIKIPFPSDIVDSFKEGTPVKIYPSGDLPYSNAWATTSENNDMIYAYVYNTIVPTTKLTPEQFKLKRVYELFPVVHMSESPNIVLKEDRLKSIVAKNNYENPLAVPEDALQKDDKGTYVLIVSPESYNLNDSYNTLFQFKVKKVYVTPGDIKRTFDLGLSRHVDTTSLKDDGGLTTENIIILAGEPGIKDGEEVVKESVRWKFLPGDSVKISIPALNTEGIYVAANAVIHQAKGHNYVYLEENGKAKLVHVNIIGRASGYNQIIGDGIKPGAKIIVIESDEELSKLYDGCPVKVEKTLPPPERIQHNRVEKLTLSLDEIAKTYY